MSTWKYRCNTCKLCFGKPEPNPDTLRLLTDVKPSKCPKCGKLTNNLRSDDLLTGIF